MSVWVLYLVVTLSGETAEVKIITPAPFLCEQARESAVEAARTTNTRIIKAECLMEKMDPPDETPGVLPPTHESKI
jgi:hypothetical protein